MISVVIPSYNRKGTILKLLADIYAQEGVTFEVIVVDDNSRDTTVTEVATRFPSVTLLRNETNRGPAVTRNRGIRHARGEIVVGFDSDVSVPDKCLLQKVVAAFAAMPEAEGLAFRLFGPDGKTDDTPRWWHPADINCSRRAFETNYFSGTAYAFRRASVIKAGLFPELLFMHYEEVELAFRILDNGGKLVYRPELTVVHHATQTSRRSDVQMFYKPRNQVLITVRCYPFLRGVAYLLPRMGFGLVTAIINRHLGRFADAMGSAMRLIPACLRERKVVRTETWRKMTQLRVANP